MKQIFLVRHADYNHSSESDPGLSEYGVTQAKYLAEQIKKSVNENELVLIWSSTAKRASQTAELLRSRLNTLEVEHEQKLWSDNRHPEDFKWLKEKLDSFTGDNSSSFPSVLIVVSHLEYVRYFPAYLGFRSNSAEYADGVVITNGQCKKLYA